VVFLTREFRMTYTQMPEKFDARGFLLLAKSGTPVYCLADNIYECPTIRIWELPPRPRKRIALDKLPTPRLSQPLVFLHNNLAAEEHHVHVALHFEPFKH
jgi:hypothetical protein